MNKILRGCLAVCCMMLIMTGCTAKEEPKQDNEIADGVYEGVGPGYAGDIRVAITVENDVITNVEILEHQESLPMGVDEMPTRIVDSGLEAELVSGATVSSTGIIAAVENALASAKGDVSSVEVIEGKEIIIVGGGNAGLNAAYHALENGATVVLLEKQGKLGGTFGGGTWIATGSQMQIEQGITNDSVDAFVADVERLNENYQERTGDTGYWMNKDLTTYFGEQMAPVTDLMDELGVDFGDRQLGNPTLYEPHDVMRVLSAGNRESMTTAIQEALVEYEENGKLQIVMNANVEGLLMADGQVVGVEYTLDGKKATYNAQAVILATGGYGYNEELISRAGLKNYTTTTPTFQTGDGYVWAEEAGAALKNMDFITVYAAGIKTEANGLSHSYSIRVKEFGDIIFVNSNGERFIDEFGPGDGSTYDAITSQWKQQEDNWVYIAVSQEQIDAMKQRGTPLISRDTDWTKFEQLLAEGEVIFKAETAQEVAVLAGINAENFSSTIGVYNGYVDAGKDEEFGRTNITMVKSSSGETVNLERDTFTRLDGEIYLIRTNPYIMICAGGVNVNTYGQAVSEDGEAVDGLFIAGELVGMANAFGRTTIGGVGNTGSAIWGKMAGEGAAMYIQGEIK